jgi:regulatory protein
VQVFVDGIAACELSRATVAAEGLRPGGTLAQAALDALVIADERRRALNTAVAMLARRPRSERDVRRRLTQRRCPPEVADETIGRLREMGALDDAAFAAAWAESRDRSSPRGRRLVERELRAFGVDGDAASTATASLDDEDAAYRLASKKARTLAGADRAAFASRLGGLLRRRGFGWEVTRAAVERCWREACRPGGT